MAQEDVLRQIAQWAERVSDEELRGVLELLTAEYRGRLRRATQRAAAGLQPGDEVQNLKPGRRLPLGARGRVVHLTRSRVHVDFGEHGTWSVPATAIAKAPPASALQDTATR